MPASPFLFDRPTVVVGEDKLQTDMLCNLLRGVVSREVVRTRDVAQAMGQISAGYAMHIVGWDRSPTEAIEYILRARRAKENPHRAAPIVVVCTNPTENDYKLAQEAGATAVFAKPVAIGPLVKMFEKVKADPRPFVDSPNYVGPCRRRGMMSGGGPRRRKSDQPVTPPPASYNSQAIKDAVLLFNQINTGALDEAAQTCVRLRKMGNAEVDAPLVAAIDLVAPHLRGSDIPGPNSIVRLGGAAIVRLAQSIGSDGAQRQALVEGLVALNRKLAAA